MSPDPILPQLHTTRHQLDLIRAGERERLAAQVRPWYGPLAVALALAPARASLGRALIRFGQAIQGATSLPVASHRAA